MNLFGERTHLLAQRMDLFGQVGVLPEQVGLKLR
jgi:hypothetical protein